MISDYGIDAARASLRASNANLFIAADGGSNRYKTGSHIKVHDFKLAFGVAKAYELQNKSAITVGAFAEHGRGNYDSYNDFGAYGEVHGWGDLRYNGIGALFHMDVAGKTSTPNETISNLFDGKNGLYVNAALRAGHAKVSFDSGDLIAPDGARGSYNSKSKYLTAMAGAGYVWNMDAKQAIDTYGRLTWGRLEDKKVEVGNDLLGFGTAHSARMRIGARYGYAYSAQVTPYVGVAYERDFKGDVSGSAYGFTIKEPSLKGNTGIVELGTHIKPVASNDALTLHMGIQGYFGQRKGANAGVKVRYLF